MSETRKLLSILFADLQGYTAIMEEDEAKALRIIEIYKREIERCCDENKGTLIQYLGDGALITFANSVDSVHFGINLQGSLIGIEGIKNRIGIHTGEVMVKDGNVHGDSVNVASRIESLALPGSLLISRTTYDQIKNKKKIGTTTMGKYHFKNQREPMEVYAVTNRPLIIPKKGSLTGKTKPQQNFNYKFLSLLLISLLVLGLIYYNSLSTSPAYDNPWLGSWNTEITLDEGVIKESLIDFSMIQDAIEGQAEILYSISREATISFNFQKIIISEDQRKISGIWQSNFTNNALSEGEFIFEFNNNLNSFSGHYTIDPEHTKYSWTGNRN